MCVYIYVYIYVCVCVLGICGSLDKSKPKTFSVVSSIFRYLLQEGYRNKGRNYADTTKPLLSV